MADLTTTDLENYNRLTTALKRLTNFHQLVSIAKRKEININVVPENTNQLNKVIELLGIGFEIVTTLDINLNFYRIDETGKPTQEVEDNEESEKLKQDLFDSFNDLKISLQVIEDEDLNLTGKIEDKRSSRIILEFLKDTMKEKNNSLTKSLLDGSQPDLTESQIKQLITSWGSAVSDFVKDASNGNDGGKFKPADLLDPVNTQKTLAAFFDIHNDLEVLYTKLADNEIVQGIS